MLRVIFLEISRNKITFFNSVIRLHWEEFFGGFNSHSICGAIVSAVPYPQGSEFPLTDRPD